MPPTITVLLPILISAGALVLAWREWRSYRSAREDPGEVLPYTRLRLVRRLAGILVLLAIGGTLAALGLAPPTNPQEASNYVLLLGAGVSVLFIVSIWDFLALARPNEPPYPPQEKMPRGPDARGRA